MAFSCGKIIFYTKKNHLYFESKASELRNFLQSLRSLLDPQEQLHRIRSLTPGFDSFCLEIHSFTNFFFRRFLQKFSPDGFDSSVFFCLERISYFFLNLFRPLRTHTNGRYFSDTLAYFLVPIHAL